MLSPEKIGKNISIRIEMTEKDCIEKRRFKWVMWILKREI